MNEFGLMAAFVITAFLCAGTWCVVKELFNRWANNDWCKHDWGPWGAVHESTYNTQLRFCRKCNRAEKSVP